MKTRITCPSCSKAFKLFIKDPTAPGDVLCPYCDTNIHVDLGMNEEIDLDEVQALHEDGVKGFDAAELLLRGMQSEDLETDEWETPDIADLNSSLTDRYQIISILGRGGMGAVYKARDTSLDRLVAVKILPLELGENTEALGRFQREAKALASLDHHNIIGIHDHGQTDDGHFYFVMEFIEGNDLLQLRRTGKIDLKSALSIVSQICAALHFAHSKGIIHRDIKPANVLVSLDGRVRVADFGLAKIVNLNSKMSNDPMLTRTGVSMGTPDYMAPEQKEGRAVDQRTDIYALGVLLYDLLTGAPPRGAWFAPSEKVEVDERLDQVIIKALQENPIERYQSIDELQADIDIIKNSTGGEPIPAGQAVDPLPSSREISGIAKSKDTAPLRATLPMNSDGKTRSRWSRVVIILSGCIVLAALVWSAVYLEVFHKKQAPAVKEKMISFQEIQDHYFSQMIASGTTAKKDLEKVQDIKPYGTLFIGASKSAMTVAEAQALAFSTGATILDYTTDQPFKPAPLNKWLSSNFSLQKEYWIRLRSQYQIIGEHARLKTADKYNKHYVLLSWQGPKEKMLKASAGVKQ